jgi:hypothetical protein
VASDETTIRVRLVATESAGSFFLNDVCSMLSARIRRSSPDEELQLEPVGEFGGMLVELGRDK